MRVGRKIPLRPKCESCGERIYRTHSPYSPIIWRDSIPVYCPRCGERLSAEKKEVLIGYDRFRWLLIFPLFIILVILTVVIYLS